MSLAERALGATLILTAVVTVAYWVNYFTSGDVAVVSARWYSAFEDSFPVADGWLALCAGLAGWSYLARHPAAGRFGLLAASALLYLASMDITFDVENSLYPLAAHSRAMQMEIVINLWSLALGVITGVVSWRKIAR